ncbi:MAG: hypothetical protein WAW54_17580 [Parvibaculum sedimenti]|uniref:hypothetical protein n=1 Tax=Parvibaculum sedimenti TaxID=2608632 RepID=UPI003BB73471
MIADRLHRRRCRLHMLKRASERGMPLSVFEVWRLERRIERCRDAFALPEAQRYQITLIIGREKFVVVYDARLRCLVTLLSRSRHLRGTAPRRAAHG